MFGRRRKDPWAYGSSVPQPFSERPRPDGGPQGLVGLALIERMPDAARMALREIDAIWRETSAVVGRARSVDDAALRELERLVTRDAPDVVAAWLSLPPDAVLDDGRTADEALVGQTEVLQAAARAIADRVLQPGRDDVAVEELYLKDKYRPAPDGPDGYLRG